MTSQGHRPGTALDIPVGSGSSKFKVQGSKLAAAQPSENVYTPNAAKLHILLHRVEQRTFFHFDIHPAQAPGQYLQDLQ